MSARPLRSASITLFRRYCGPGRHRLVFDRFPGWPVIRLPAPPISRWDEDGFTSCSTCPCHRAAPNHPAEVTCSRQSVCGTSCSLRPTIVGSAFGVEFCRGHHWVHLRCGPVTRSPSQGRLCRLASSASFPPRMQPKLRGSDSFPGGTHLPLNMPAFRWSHYGQRIHAARW